MAQKKLIRVALHIRSDSVNTVLESLKDILMSGDCEGVEAIEAKDNAVISILAPKKDIAQAPPLPTYTVGEKVSYLDNATGEEYFAVVKFLQGDKVGIEVAGETHRRLVDPMQLNVWYQK